MNKVLTVCPCCGNRSATAEIGVPCGNCGAQRVGEPLAHTTPELPSYGRALLALALPATLLLMFVAPSAAKIYQGFVSFDWQTLETDLLTFAWWLRWVSPVAAFIVLWSVVRLHRTVSVAPARFAGQRVARAGLVLSVLTLVASLAMVGGQIPRHRRDARIAAEAHQNALLYHANSQFLKYRASFGTYPAQLKDLHRLPDTDGSVAHVIASFDANSYRPSSAQTANARTANLSSTSNDVRFVNAGGDDRTASEILSFTNYELVAPGADETLGTADDRVMRDGALVEMPATDPLSTAINAAVASSSAKNPSPVTSRITDSGVPRR